VFRRFLTKTTGTIFPVLTPERLADYPELYTSSRVWRAEPSLTIGVNIQVEMSHCSEPLFGALPGTGAKQIGRNIGDEYAGSQVKIDDTGLAAHNRLRHPACHLMGCPFRSVSVRSRLKISFENRLQDELEPP